MWIALTYQEIRPWNPGKKPGRKPEKGWSNCLRRMNKLLLMDSLGIYDKASCLSGSETGMKMG